MEEPKDDDSDLSPEEMAEEVEREFRMLRMKRVKKKLVERTSSKHLVESSLEDFVAKARGNEVDVSAFVPETREQMMVREIEGLKKRLADAEARLAEETSKPVPEVDTRRRWPTVVAAFVVGAASMFAVSFATKSEPRAGEHVATPPPVAPTRPLPEAPRPIDPTPSVAEPPAVTEPPLADSPHETQPLKPVAAKKPRPATVKPAPKKEDGLYDPFGAPQ